MMLLLRDAACAAVFCVFSVSSAAALTAEEVWADWQRLAGGGQVALTATATRDGDRLVLTDISFPFGTATSNPDRVTLERIELQELPDGRVAVLLPDRFPVVFANGDKASSGPDVVTLSASAPGFSMIIADIGEKAAFEVMAPSLVLSLEKVEPVPQADERVDVNFAMADLSVRQRMDMTQPTETLSSVISVGTVHGDILIDVDDPDQVKVDMSVDIAGWSSTVDIVMPPSAQNRPLDAAAETGNPLPEILSVLGDGLIVKAEASYGPFALRMDLEKRPDEPLQFDLTSASGRALVTVDPASIGYDVGIGKTAFSAVGGPPELELASANMSVTELGYSLSVGIGDLVTPQEASANVRVVDLTLPPEAWAKADPTGTFGSSPLTFVIDVAGRYALAPEMLKPDWEPVPGTFPPIDIVDVTLSELLVSGFGVNMTGGGSLTFDETDLVTFDGLPAPDGKMSFLATGINALIDRSVAAGLIPENELTGLRLGLAFIAKPGAEPDTLASEIEFRDKGLFLNGQQLR
jgi:Uncharacterized protein conserved in bacteria (DUF2125)